MMNETPDLLTGVEAQQVVSASLDMLDALECLILFASEHYPNDLTLDVWKKAARVVKLAGGNTFDNIKA
jgi:hypothetical protein